MIDLKNFSLCFLGLIAGVISGLLGTGGGIILIPSLCKIGFDQKSAHATSVSTMLPICTVGTFMHIYSSSFRMEQSAIYVIFGLIGAFIGTRLIHKINQNILRNIFALFSIWAGFRLILK